MIALYVYDTTTHSLYIDTCINAYTHCTLYTNYMYRMYYVYTMYTLTYTCTYINDFQNLDSNSNSIFLRMIYNPLRKMLRNIFAYTMHAVIHDSGDGACLQ